MCRGQSNRTLMPCSWWAGGRSLRQTMKMKIEIFTFHVAPGRSCCWKFCTRVDDFPWNIHPHFEKEKSAWPRKDLGKTAHFDGKLWRFFGCWFLPRAARAGISFFFSVQSAQQNVTFLTKWIRVFWDFRIVGKKLCLYGTFEVLLEVP